MTRRGLSAILAGLVLALAWPAAAGAQPATAKRRAPGDEASAQPAAPAQLGAADLALFNGVRRAGLWEMPAGQMAAERGSDQRVREVGRQIAAEHAELDQIVVDAANKLGVQLPSKPSATQQKWLDEMRGAASDREFDRIFVHRLRAAHGVIFPVISSVRSGTRNEVTRQLADAANKFVLNHLTLLESTGLVRYEELPPAVLPGDQARGDVLQAGTLARSTTGNFNSAVVWAIILLALLAGVGGTWRIFRAR